MYDSVTALLCEPGWIRKQVPGPLDWGEEASSVPAPRIHCCYFCSGFADWVRPLVCFQGGGDARKTLGDREIEGGIAQNLARFLCLAPVEQPGRAAPRHCDVDYLCAE